MKREIVYFAIYIVFAFNLTAEDLIAEKTRIIYESFQDFRGTFQTIPCGFSVSWDGQNNSTNNTDFLGVHSGGVRTGGCYAWLVNQTNYVLGCQPTSDKFSPGYFEISIVNKTGNPVESAEIAYEVWFYNDADRACSLEALVCWNEGEFVGIQGSRVVTPVQIVQPVMWQKVEKQLQIKFRPALRNNERIRLRWVIDDAGGSGSRDEIGIDNVRIKLMPPSGLVISIQ